MGQLYATLSPRLERIVRGRLPVPKPVLEDACQVAWSRLLRHRGSVRRENVLAWLVTTAVHEAVKLVSREGREASLEAELEEHGEDALSLLVPGPDQLLEDRELLACLRYLPARQQRLVWLHALGLNYVEIACAEGCSRRTVERQLLRARRRLANASTFSQP